MACVDWSDVKAYVQWLSEQTGHTYRLLSEAEWEYVARAGATTTYPWGDGEDGACKNANVYDADSAIPLIPGETLSCVAGFKIVSPSGQFEPNAFGVYDMIGNVWEWTQDCWNGSYAGAPSDGSAWTRGDCDRRVLRGGSWSSRPIYLRAANRYEDSRGNRSDVGFRVAAQLVIESSDE